jgi:precorrin-6A/cobalt-precorrin-6A reductase
LRECPEHNVLYTIVLGKTRTVANQGGLKRIWLIGGTQESAELARAIDQAQLPCLISVTTETARHLYPPSPYLKIWVGSLPPDRMAQFIPAQKIGVILDASHPFATVVSQAAIEAATFSKIPYLRYERQNLPTTPNAQPHEYHISLNTLLSTLSSQTPNPVRVASPQEKLRSRSVSAGETPNSSEFRIPNSEFRILLILGYRLLPLFQDLHDRATLFARILPSPTALNAALEAGFTADRLIALRPPVSAALERSLWQQWQITMVVAKASGVAGGEDVKRAVAAELGIPLVLIDRPSIIYPRQTSEVAEAIEFCKKMW